MRVYDRIMCFVNCHSAAHLEAVNRRNADFDHIYQTMVFSRSSNILNTASGMVSYLFLSCTLAFSTYLFWLLYSFGLPLVLSVAAGVSTTVQMLRGTSVCAYCELSFKNNLLFSLFGLKPLTFFSTICSALTGRGDQSRRGET